PVPKAVSELSMDAAACIECGACVAQCPNGAAQLFTAAKVSHLGLLPQGQPERYERVLKMVEVMEEYFGSCTMFRECEAVCPEEWAARKFRDAGVPVTLESYTLPATWRSRAATAEALAPATFPLRIAAAPFTASTSGAIEGTLVDFGDGNPEILAKVPESKGK